MVVPVRRRGVWWVGPWQRSLHNCAFGGRAVVRRGGKGGLKTELDGE